MPEQSDYMRAMLMQGLIQPAMSGIVQGVGGLANMGMYLLFQFLKQQQSNKENEKIQLLENKMREQLEQIEENEKQKKSLFILNETKKKNQGNNLHFTHAENNNFLKMLNEISLPNLNNQINENDLKAFLGTGNLGKTSKLILQNANDNNEVNSIIKNSSNGISLNGSQLNKLLNFKTTTNIEDFNYVDKILKKYKLKDKLNPLQYRTVAQKILFNKVQELDDTDFFTKINNKINDKTKMSTSDGMSDILETTPTIKKFLDKYFDENKVKTKTFALNGRDTHEMIKDYLTTNEKILKENFTSVFNQLNPNQDQKDKIANYKILFMKKKYNDEVLQPITDFKTAQINNLKNQIDNKIISVKKEIDNDKITYSDLVKTEPDFLVSLMKNHKQKIIDESKKTIDNYNDKYFDQSSGELKKINSDEIYETLFPMSENSKIKKEFDNKSVNVLIDLLNNKKEDETIGSLRTTIEENLMNFKNSIYDDILSKPKKDNSIAPSDRKLENAGILKKIIFDSSKNDVDDKIHGKHYFRNDNILNYSNPINDILEFQNKYNDIHGIKINTKGNIINYKNKAYVIDPDLLNNPLYNASGDNINDVIDKIINNKHKTSSRKDNVKLMYMREFNQKQEIKKKINYIKKISENPINFNEYNTYDDINKQQLNIEEILNKIPQSEIYDDFDENQAIIANENFEQDFPLGLYKVNDKLYNSNNTTIDLQKILKRQKSDEIKQTKTKRRETTKEINKQTKQIKQINKENQKMVELQNLKKQTSDLKQLIQLNEIPNDK